MEPTKISFGFSKIQKKSNVVSKVPAGNNDNKVELVKCLEGQTIQLLDEKPKEEDKPLIIPLKESTKTAAALASLKARYNVLNNVVESEGQQNDAKPGVTSNNAITNESLEQKAAREILELFSKKEENGADSQDTIAVPKPDELPLDGAKESTIDDYESIPISKFGYAMLRGMGWKEEPKRKGDGKDTVEPIVRPKGMGLGADKIAKQKPPLIAPEANEILEIKKNASVRILAGKHKDLYGQIEGFDDHAGRVIVKLALGGHYESLNEFMVQPVSKKEYAQYSKVINSAKYEEYKKLENEHGQIILKAPKPEKHEDYDREERKPIVKQEGNHHSQSTSSRQRYSSESDNDHSVRHRSRQRKEETNRQHRHVYEERRSSSQSSSNESSSDHYRRSAKKKSSKSKKHKDRSRRSLSEDEKRHKKKTKKSKRPRSRSRGRHR